MPPTFRFPNSVKIPVARPTTQCYYTISFSVNVFGKTVLFILSLPGTIPIHIFLPPSAVNARKSTIGVFGNPEN
jgi:hypothetical protein